MLPYPPFARIRGVHYSLPHAVVKPVRPGSQLCFASQHQAGYFGSIPYHTVHERAVKIGQQNSIHRGDKY